ncbi:MAG: ABC transporter substrate-binding protein [Deltaproteobacteria bacterium]|nr:MAG: ABC transporter substrate-binding protein [Deltaproteobacteria bacterium]
MRTCIAVLAAATLFLAGLLTAQAEAATPREEISATVDRILTLLRDKDMDRMERRRTLTDTIEARFDFDTMARSTLGKYWKKASSEQRQRFKELFSDLLESTYLGRIEAYTDETVSYGEEKVRGNKALVETSVHSGNTDIPIHYKLVQKQNGWYVYDVVIEGVSLVRNFRSSYGTIVKKEGFDQLFGRMEEKIAELKRKQNH